MKKTLHLFYSGAFAAILLVLLGLGNGDLHLQGKANPMVGKESIPSVAYPNVASRDLASPDLTSPDLTDPNVTEATNVLVGAGDIANCNTSFDSAF